MKKIKFLMIAMMAFVISATFTACGDDDNSSNNNKRSNYDRYQRQ